MAQPLGANGPGQDGPSGPTYWPRQAGPGLSGTRVVRLWGPLDEQSVGRAAAELMTLDATGDDPVELVVASEGGPLNLALSLVDTIDLLGVPVHATCLGRAEGSAVLVVAVATRRVAAPHAQFRLGAPTVSASGSAAHLTAWAEQQRVELERYSLRLAQACGRHLEHVEADLAAGRWLDAPSAISYGLVDAIWSPPAKVPPQSQRPPRHLGFAPSRDEPGPPAP